MWVKIVWCVKEEFLASRNQGKTGSLSIQEIRKTQAEIKAATRNGSLTFGRFNFEYIHTSSLSFWFFIDGFFLMKK
jgi:hypothetical protein